VAVAEFLRILERMFDIAAVSRATAGLAAVLQSPSGLDDAGRVDAIRALEELGCVVSAAQAALSAELDESQRAEQQAAGVPVTQQGRGVAAQVALARRESHHRGQRHLGLAKVVAAELPHTWAAWRAGRITEWKATLVARETVFLSQEDRLHVDEVVASDQDRLEEMGDRQLAAACQKAAYLLDPESYVSRRRHAEADRRVTIRPAPDAMVWLTALLPVKVGVGAYAALTGSAASARAAGDRRTKGQVMADTLVRSVLAGAADPEADETHDVPVPVSLGLVMTDQALFGTSDEPAYVESYGPIPAELAREIIAGACTREERLAVRRLYTSPATGELVSMDSRSRSFAGALGRFIRLRDRTCRTPWCDAPVRHADHAEEHAHGGPTSAVNGQGLCEACNHAKQAPGWRAGPSPGPGPHEIGTTTPTGHTYQSRAPAIVATIRETPIRLDLILAS
jgi:hypothetical protein